MKISITIKAILKKKKIMDLKNKTVSVFNSISMAGLQDDLSMIFFNMDYSEIPWITLVDPMTPLDEQIFGGSCSEI